MHSRTMESTSNGISRMTTFDKKGENGVRIFYEEDEDGTLRRAPNISKKASRRTSSGGSHPKRQSSGQSQTFKTSDAHLEGALHRRAGSHGSRQSVQMSEGPLSVASEEKSGGPGLNGYLSTIYSERPTPVPSPSTGDGEQLGDGRKDS